MMGLPHGGATPMMGLPHGGATPNPSTAPGPGVSAQTEAEARKTITDLGTSGTPPK
jgi:hypothetical protein